MGIDSSTGNYVQPDYRIPTVDARVADYPVGYNVMDLTWPIPKYTQPDNPTSTDPAFPLGD